jgi:Domain of unknown function (DUF3883)
MPVVLTTAPGKRRSGHTYDDRTGVAYEFPPGRYERWIVPGEPFLYYEPRQGYSGTGVIGRIAPSPASGRLIAEVLDYRPLPVVVPIRSPAGDYYEADGAFWRDGQVYWAQGVRPLGMERFTRVLHDAGPLLEAEQATTPESSKSKRSSASYPPSAVATAVEKYSVEIAMARLRAEFPDHEVVEMPRNNPGFDIRVGAANDPLLYVEVKGTQTEDPVFFLSEGEREFSVHNGGRYRLFIICAVDLASEAHGSVHKHDGAIDATVADLKPSQWRARLQLLADATKRAGNEHRRPAEPKFQKPS